MSRVTNVILTTHVAPCGDDSEIVSVNAYLQKVAGCVGDSFVEVSDHSGGTKRMECRVYLAAFNHVETELILAAVDQAPWADKDMVQVFVKEQEEDKFQLRYDGESPRKPDR